MQLMFDDGGIPYPFILLEAPIDRTPQFPSPVGPSHNYSSSDRVRVVLHLTLAESHILLANRKWSLVPHLISFPAGSHISLVSSLQTRSPLDERWTAFGELGMFKAAGDDRFWVPGNVALTALESLCNLGETVVQRCSSR